MNLNDLLDKHSSGKYLGSDSTTRYYKFQSHALYIDPTV